MFQSTHPGRSATSPRPFFNVALLVSIHAPRVGCDIYLQLVKLAVSCFNPRTPGGVRLGFLSKIDYFHMFQSTHPGRGATPVCVIIRLASLFQSTHPGRGATQQSRIIQAYGMFQSTHPGRGATVANEYLVCDFVFQSTHPGRGATLQRQSQEKERKFQSTHPARGATCCT